MAFTQTQLTAIEDAIASGATRVAYDGKSVDYGSLDTLLRIRDIIRRALGLTPAASATVVVAHDRGYPGPATWGDDGLFSGF
jgi:hypothetical protein